MTSESNNAIATVLLSAESALYLKQRLSTEEGQPRYMSNIEFCVLKKLERFLQEITGPVRARHAEILKEVLEEFPDLEGDASADDIRARAQTRELALNNKLRTDQEMARIQTEEREFTLSKNDFEVIVNLFETGTFSEYDLKYSGIIDFFTDLVFEDLSDLYVVTPSSYYLSSSKEDAHE